ncbi:MAG: redox-sensing transcriptional repressor Rex [Treponema sp.]|nr:redox-sensing transcriptional repressor Rex [Treponema sp.]
MKPIPEPSKRRLVLLERFLSGCKEETLSSTQLAKLTGWSAALIRRDISLLDVHAGGGSGYRTSELQKALALLISDSAAVKKCCIVGLGRMGQVLLDTAELNRSSFTLVAGFDSSVNRTEVLRSAFPLHPTTMLEHVIESEGIEYAVLTVGEEEAQSMAERLCKCGIKGIVNYTPKMLIVPQNVAVENVSLLTALELLNAGRSL